MKNNLANIDLEMSQTFKNSTNMANMNTKASKV